MDKRITTVRGRKTISKKRLEYIDIARGIAIISIILGHLGLRSINKIVFTFHVPIFFLITGYFLNTRCSLKEFVKNKARTLLIPYFITSLVIIGLATLKGIIFGGTKEAFVEWLYAALYGAGDNYTEPFYIKGIGAIWFLWATFWGSCFLKISLKLSKWFRLLFVLGLFGIGYGSRVLFWFPLSIQAGMCSTLFMYIGYQYREIKEQLEKMPDESKCFLAVFAFGTWISFINQFQSFWLVHCDVGRGIIDIFGAVCGCICVIMISKFIEGKIQILAKPLSFLGKYSLFVLCIHIVELDIFPWWSVTGRLVECGLNTEYQLFVIIVGKFIM